MTTEHPCTPPLTVSRQCPVVPYSLCSETPVHRLLSAYIHLSQAREEELEYFRGHKQWAQALAAQPALVDRLGAAALRSGLSALLVAQVGYRGRWWAPLWGRWVTALWSRWGNEQLPCELCG